MVGSALFAGAVAARGGRLRRRAGRATVVGRLVQAWPEAGTGAPGPSRPISWVQNADGDAVRIPTDDVDGIPPAPPCRSPSPPADDDAGGPAARRSPARRSSRPAHGRPVLRNPAGLTNQITVVRVAPDGAAPDAVTTQQLVDAVDGPVAGFWSEQSNGAISVGVTAVTRDWVTPAAGCADPTALWNEVAATVGFCPARAGT